MYTRLTSSGGRTYLQIVESFRGDKGVRQRVIANLGRLDQLEPKHLEPLINGLNRAIGRADAVAHTVEYDSARSFEFAGFSRCHSPRTPVLAAGV